MASDLSHKGLQLLQQGVEFGGAAPLHVLVMSHLEALDIESWVVEQRVAVKGTPPVEDRYLLFGSAAQDTTEGNLQWPQKAPKTIFHQISPT